MKANRGTGATPHRPVLYEEIIHALSPQSEGRYVDCTVGAGGHAFGILEASAPGGLLLGLDRDRQILEYAQQNLASFGDRVTLMHASFESLEHHIRTLGWPAVDGVVLDLGVSSVQLDEAERGFSFRSDGPLDMRFDSSAALKAEDLVNGLSESELADLIFQYGEERQSRRIARAVVAARPIHKTVQLAEVITLAVRGRRGRIHPATRTFQALRIAVNGELQALESVLPQTVRVLRSGGRLAVISFHSLEDRMVKTFMRDASRDCICPPEQPVCNCRHQASLRLLGKRAQRPAEAEVQRNPRSRSARLRVAEKI